ncbi:hypothetical protein [Burkholderia ambifaria]|uniref:hypothetical protein n=1 Tax=Burkholderia ambifaria TaxID=152480 RepID=UPI000F81188E|nr:hypothetical protein [Burkholderia ambifaria]
MTRYTLIAHKPESSDYCMGCLMATYSGDFELAHGPTLDALAPLYLRAAQANRTLDHGELGYELTLLVNGCPLDDIPDTPWENWTEEGGDALLAKLAADARTWLARMEQEAEVVAAEKRRGAEQAEAARKQRQAHEAEQREHAQYLALHAKFGGHARA